MHRQHGLRLGSIAPQSTWREWENYHSSAADYLNYPSNLPQGPLTGALRLFRRTNMTKRKSKSTKSTVKAVAAKASVTKSSNARPATTPPLIVLGFDEQQKPRGARFVDAKPDLVTKVADLLGFKVYEASSEDMPNVRQSLYSDLVVVLGQEPDAALSRNGNGLPVALGLPRSWDELAPGHLVIAQEALEYGWWEAIVLDRQGDTFTLQYRDYPHLPKFVRHRSGIAMMSPPTDEAKPETQANLA